MQKYTVVIPAYNASRTIEETLKSVAAQTVQPAEIIVIDDGSTDDTAIISKRFAPLTRVLQQPNKGPGSATNLGLANAQTSVISMIDADDLWHPMKMEKQLTALACDTAIDVVYCYQRQFRHGVPDDGTGEVRLGLNRSNITLRKEVYDCVGELSDQPGQRGEMIDWLARIRQAGFRIHELAEVLAYRRIIPGSLSWRREASKDIGYLTVAYAAMQRNRRRNQINKADKK